jgi:hypothetical protein
MSNAIDPAFDRLNALEPELSAALAAGQNESDTRLKVLDRILFEVLGWKHEVVFTEPPTASGYIDYLLTIGERKNAMVIEAKRTGKLTPASKSTEVMHVALKGPVVQPLRDGIDQAMRYATENGVAVAAVTDGNTWLFFRASRTDGKPPLEGKGVLFPTLKTVRANFAKFAELLAPGAVIDRRQLAHLSEAEGLAVAEAEQQFFVLDPKEARMRQRDPLASDAALLFSQFFSRLSNEQDREMLRDCFVETNESRKADIELEKIIQRVLNNILALDTGQGTALQAELERTMMSRRSETILLIGNKGAGKSTFVDRFFNQVLPLRLREKCAVAHINLEDYHGDPKGVVTWAILRLRGELESQVCASHPPEYDELQGIFFSEYKRWSTGTRKYLYESDKIEFKNQFGLHIEERREKHPDEYVRILLDWASRGHQKLPCLIFDNTDQFLPEVQDMVYQLAHSYESAAPVFNVVPITDRTVWRLSKAGALQSYTSRSFYLPVPDAKEIISRRVEFLKLKVKAEPAAAKSYFSKKGFQVEVNDLAVLADAVGKVFVENDYVSGMIGRLGNFDIRRMLRLAERIFLSPELKIDDIIRSRFGGATVTADKFRTQRALIKGEYDRFSEGENEFISNVFQTNANRPESPLLAYYLLWLLRQKLNSVRDDSVESRHWGVAELYQLFEGCGVAEELVLYSLNRMYDRRLIEALDPNIKQISMGDRVAIKESGLAHIDLVLNSQVYVEQMALVTGINEHFAKEEIRQELQKGQMNFAREAFVRYILKIDAGRVGIPQNPMYSQIAMARRQIEALLPRRRSTPRAAAK